MRRIKKKLTILTINFNMMSQFLKSYISNMDVLCKELFRNQRSIQVLSDNIKTLTSDVEQKFKQLVVDMMKKQRSHGDDETNRNFQIKVIYLLIRQIQKSDAEKRSLTRKACDILDKYLASMGRNVEIAQTHHPNEDEDLLKTLSSIKLEVSQPMQGNAAIIDLIKKMESGGPDENAKASTDVNKNVEVFGTAADNCSDSTFGDVAKQITNLISRMDNLQAFTDKVIDICSEMRNRLEAS